MLEFLPRLLLEKRADADRAKMVHDYRYARGLEKETWEEAHKPHYQGRLLKDNERVVGKGGNSAVVDKEHYAQTLRDMSEYADAHPWQVYGMYPAVAGGAALAGLGGAAAASAGLPATLSAIGNEARMLASTVRNPLAAAGAPRWVGPAVATVGAVGPHVVRALPSDAVDKVPQVVKDDLGYLRYVSPFHGLATSGAVTAGVAGMPLLMQGARNYVNNYGKVRSQDSIPVSIAKALPGEALELAKDRVVESAREMFGDKVEQAKEFGQKTLDRAATVAGEYANRGLAAAVKGLEYTQMGAEKAIELLNRGQLMWDEIPPELQGVILSVGTDKIAPWAFDRILSLKYPDFDMDAAVENVNDFYNRIVQPTKERFGGEPGKDYNAENYRSDFVKDLGIAQHSDVFKPVYGWSSNTDLRNKVHMNKPTLARIVEQFPDAVEYVLAHEGTHEQNNDTPAFGLGRAHSGVSKDEQGKLDEAYGFDAKSMKPFYPAQGAKARKALAAMEEATSNREFRLALDRMFREQLGRSPDVDEFIRMLDSMPDKELQRFREEAPVFNGYIEDWRKRVPKLDRKQLEAWRRALREVASNAAAQRNGVLV